MINKHMMHLEELLLSDSNTYFKYLEKITKIGRTGIIDNNVLLSVKYDGSPSVCTGTNPDNGQFFVSTKGIFNKTPKVAHSREEVATVYNHDIELQAKMYYLFQYLEKVKDQIPNIIQGDLLFTPQSKYALSNDFNIVYKPNLISYEFSDIDLHDIGIAWHTSYHGETLAGIIADETPNIQWIQHPKILSVNPYEFTQTKTTDFITQPAFYWNTMITDTSKEFIMKFVNFILKSGYKIETIQYDDINAEFWTFMDKRPEGKLIKNELSQFSFAIIQMYFDFIKETKSLKNQFLSLFEVPNIKAYIGDKKIRFEGMVMKIHGHDPIKIIDRDEFSFANFNYR